MQTLIRKITWDELPPQLHRLSVNWGISGSTVLRSPRIHCWVKVESLSRVRLFATPMDHNLPGSSVHRIFQARVLEWVAISFSRGSSWPSDQTRVSHIAGRHYRLSHQGSPTEALLPPKWCWFHHSKWHDWCWYSKWHDFFFIVSPPNLLTRWAPPLLLPHANLSQPGPPDTLHPPPAVPCPLVSPIQISFVLQGALSWGQQAEDFWLHRFCVFRFQAQIVCTAHFSPSHAPLCFVIELVRVYVFTRWNKDSLKTSPLYLWCFTLQPHLKCSIYWPPWIYLFCIMVLGL